MRGIYTLRRMDAVEATRPRARARRRPAEAKAAAAAQPLSDLLAEVKEALGEQWLPRIYRERILPLRTRAHHVEVSKAREPRVLVQHTLLGVELKIDRRRVVCPDLATARYLAVFARANCANVAVPYDITRVSRLADELESAWHRMILVAEQRAGDRSAAFGSRLRKSLVRDARDEIAEAGAGTLIPQFNQNTKQRTGPMRAASRRTD